MSKFALVPNSFKVRTCELATCIAAGQSKFARSSYYSVQRQGANYPRDAANWSPGTVTLRTPVVVPQ